MIKITKEMVERVARERKMKEKLAYTVTDLERYLRWLPYYKRRPEGGTTQQTPWTRDIILFNTTVFVDSSFNMVHQGDITVDTLKGIRKRIGDHKVYLFWEHNPHKPMFPFDLTALNPATGMARPFGKAKVVLEMADIILERDRCLINNGRFIHLKKNCERAGFKVEVNRENYW